MFGLFALPAGAQDVEGSKDHPMFSRMPGYEIQEYDEQEFGAHEFLLEPEKRVEGRYWRISYGVKEGAKKSGPLQIARNYTNLLVQRKGRKLSEEVHADGGVSIATMPVSGGRTLWLEVTIGNSGDYYTLTVVEEAGMAQKVEFTASDLADALSSTGRVAVRSILFDTGKAAIKPESASILATIGEVLKADPALKLEIEGHTDNVGGAAANLKLSQDRAGAVKAHLVKEGGIDAGRLTTSGFGDTKPVADNATDDGRAQNRRVELVRK
jgi:outer membrane protein OmpA-like peptidoglycan-associated protein